MLWQTIIDKGFLKKKINYSDSLMMLGSCFTDNVGGVMKDLMFDVSVNPFGVLYNPASVSGALDALENNTTFVAEDLVENGGVWKSIYHGSAFYSSEKDDLLGSLNSSLEKESLFYKKSSYVVVTLGTAWVYRDKSRGVIVSNCHKLPASAFERFVMSVDDIVSSLASHVEENQDKEWIFTVSPVRHLKDGAHGNQLSKARLLLACEKLVSDHINAHYFPSYEIFMDELRDYRYYASDMVHPSESAVRYTWDCFREYAVDPLCEERMRKAGRLYEMKRHRPLFPDSKEYDEFLKKMEALESELRQFESKDRGYNPVI
jgi:hypothetical protein